MNIWNSHPTNVRKETLAGPDWVEMKLISGRLRKAWPPRGRLGFGTPCEIVTGSTCGAISQPRSTKLLNVLKQTVHFQNISIPQYCEKFTKMQIVTLFYRGEDPTRRRKRVERPKQVETWSHVFADLIGHFWSWTILLPVPIRVYVLTWNSDVPRFSLVVFRMCMATLTITLMFAFIRIILIWLTKDRSFTCLACVSADRIVDCDWSRLAISIAMMQRDRPSK